MAQEFKLNIRLGNAAMQNAEDIAIALRDLADILEFQNLWRDESESVKAQSVFDTNGNRVGQWAIK